MDDTYKFPIIGLKALTSYRPHNYQFALHDKTLFDISQYPKGVNGHKRRYQRGFSEVSGKSVGGPTPVPEGSGKVPYDPTNAVPSRRLGHGTAARSDMVC